MINDEYNHEPSERAPATLTLPARKPAAGEGADGAPERAPLSPAADDVRRAQQLARQVGLALDRTVELDSEKLAAWFADAKRQKEIHEALLGAPYPDDAPAPPASPVAAVPVKGEVIRIKAGPDGEPDRDDALRVADRLVAMTDEGLLAVWAATQSGLRRARSQMRDPIDVGRMREVQAGARLILRAAAKRGLALPPGGGPPTTRPGRER